MVALRNRIALLKSRKLFVTEDIDAVFVTVEPQGGSQHPSGKQLRFASHHIARTTPKRRKKQLLKYFRQPPRTFVINRISRSGSVAIVVLGNSREGVYYIDFHAATMLKIGG